MDFDVRDLVTGADLADAYAVECEATSNARRGWVPLGESARVSGWQSAPGWSHRLVGAFEGDHLMGFASASTAHDSPETCWVDASVLPDRQGCGVGARLVRIAEGSSADSVTRFVASAYRATTAEVGSLAQGFAGPLGYAVATTETVVELDLTNAQLPSIEDRLGEYTLATYVNGVPDELRVQVGALKGLVDAEAPNGELNWQPTPVSPEEYADEIALWRRQGRTAIESLALTSAGDVAAWTCLVVAPHPDRPAHVEGTLVVEGHRGSGLGKAVKLASLFSARHETNARRVRTSSDDQNVWMRAINDQLGFVAIESEVVFQRFPSATTRTE